MNTETLRRLGRSVNRNDLRSTKEGTSDLPLSNKFPGHEERMQAHIERVKIEKNLKKSLTPVAIEV